MGADCKGFTDWGNVSGVPIGQSAPAFFLESYPQPYPQLGTKPVDKDPAVGRVGRAGQESRQARELTPHVLNVARLHTNTPQQNIFAKVKSPLTCGYTICAVTHTAKNAK
jgi:hypothetical protein